MKQEGLVVRIKVAVEDIAELICNDDPECSPTVGYGCAVAEAVARKLGLYEYLGMWEMREHVKNILKERRINYE